MNRKGFFALLSRVWMTMLRQLQTSFRYRRGGGDDNDKLPSNNGRARVEKIYGNTVVWNQYIDKNIITNPTTRGVTRTTVGNNFHLQGTATDTNYGPVFNWTEVRPIIGHRYLYLFRFSGQGSSSLKVGDQYQNFSPSVDSFIGLASLDSHLIAQSFLTNGVDYDCDVYINLFDLTKMFGSDNQIAAALGVSNLTDPANLTKAAENFEKLFPNSYYPYCTGRLVNLGGYGVKMNQLVQNGDFATVNYWNRSNATITVSNNICSMTATSQNGYIFQKCLPTVANHKILISVDVQTTAAASEVELYGYGGYMVISIPAGIAWQHITGIVTTSSSWGYDLLNNNLISFRDKRDSNRDAVLIKNVMACDLTEMFGPGSEPTLEEFEAMFPDDYYEYNAGTEMNILDAVAGENKLGLESTGFNLWDEEWEVGIYNSTTGQKGNNYNSIRSKNFIPIIPNTTYYQKVPNAVAGLYKFYRYYYDSQKNYISGGILTDSGIFTPDSNVRYMTFDVRTIVTYNNDICINISDPSRNGTYEPYKKDTLDLDWIRNEGVENFNVWDGVLESGYWDALTGESGSGSNWKRSKNPIEAFPNTDYYWKVIKKTNVGVGYFVYYDAEMNYIGSSVGAARQKNNVHTTPANCRFIHFYLGSQYTKSDICINISNPALNGEYHPYGEKAKYFPQGLLSAGNIYDEVQENKLIKRMGSVNLGSLSWTAGSVAGLFLSQLSGVKIVTAGIKPNDICSKYAVGTTIISSTNAEDKNIYQGNANNYIFFKDTVFSGYTDTQVAEALSGVMLYYELATPVEIPLSTPHKLIYRANKYCIEEILPSPIPGSSPLSSSIIADITYQNK